MKNPGCCLPLSFSGCFWLQKRTHSSPTSTPKQKQEEEEEESVVVEIVSVVVERESERKWIVLKQCTQQEMLTKNQK